LFEKISLALQNLFHCRVRFDPLQEKNAFLTPVTLPELGGERAKASGKRRGRARTASRRARHAGDDHADSGNASGE